MWCFFEHTTCILGLLLTQNMLLAAASPLKQSHYVLKDSHTVPSGWETLARAPGERRINLKVGLKHGKFEELERRLYEGMGV